MLELYQGQVTVDEVLWKQTDAIFSVRVFYNRPELVPPNFNPACTATFDRNQQV